MFLNLYFTRYVRKLSLPHPTLCKSHDFPVQKGNVPKAQRAKLRHLKARPCEPRYGQIQLKLANKSLAQPNHAHGARRDVGSACRGQTEPKSFLLNPTRPTALGGFLACPKSDGRNVANGRQHSSASRGAEYIPARRLGYEVVACVSPWRAVRGGRWRGLGVAWDD